MKKQIIIIILLSTVLPINSQSWDLIWSDEFNYNGLPDTTKWINEVGQIRNNELQYYTYQRLENSIVENGNLLIIGEKEPYKGADYTSASITTDNMFSYKYGKIEARIKLQIGQGIWAGIWLLGQNFNQVGWPECGEIDIAEHINNDNKIYTTMHWENNGHVSYGGTVDCDMRQYHNFSLEWDEKSIIWLVDGTKYLVGNIENNINSTDEFHNNFYIILNMALGGTWPGNPDNTTIFPDTMFVDYVRVYKKATVLVDELSQDMDIKIIPNPAIDNITVQLPPQIKDGEISINNLIGEKLISKYIKKNTPIEIGYLPKGIYILRYTFGSITLSQKFIKK